MVTTIIEAFRFSLGRIWELGERTRKPIDNLIAKRRTEYADVRRDLVKDETQDVCGCVIIDGCGEH
jgi:hypothetical protein